jgi:hypothetical protein
MSRTDVHRPWRVQLADPYNRHLFYGYPAWPWEMGLAPIKNIGCGCSLCTGQPGRKRARRQDRYAARRALRTAAAQYAGGDLNEDLLLPRPAEAW